MKKLICTVAFVALFITGAMLFAQDDKEDNGKEKKKNESEYYYKNISLEKIYPYRNGYVVQYNRGIGKKMGMAYIPMAWFTDSAGKGEIVSLSKGSAWPSLSVYYKDGEFSHVRLYVHRSPNHQTWGVIPQNINLDDRFDGVEDLKMKY